MSHYRKIKPTTSLADEVYSQVVDAITAGLIVPQERIIQEKLADELEVSRTPVREALLRLELEGVLVRVGRTGFTIRTFDDDEVLKVYQTREAIEGYAAGCLSQIADAAVLKRLEAHIKQTEDVSDSSVRAIFEANRSIHRAFVEATDNEFLLEMFDSLWNRSIAFYLIAEMDSASLTRSLHGHLQLCEAIGSGSESKATNSMRAHINGGLQLQRDVREMQRVVDDQSVVSVA